ncbi:hypothetical protein [Kutzneria sp. CA-103260]|uniref:hypothetical protein n=1 Tax=Kutzneria sp. CA-103260 TaxID=2802641 RepID=UPI001BA756C9|nr:hypothetical protein [Kutzneria sp. CA-103260]QUQ70381.1 hypothetical protein JJ691_81570 [Kutzneria sp. CA-103260]
MAYNTLVVARWGGPATWGCGQLGHGEATHWIGSGPLSLTWPDVAPVLSSRTFQQYRGHVTMVLTSSGRRQQAAFGSQLVGVRHVNSA